MKLQDYFKSFNEKFSSLDLIDKNWYKDELNITAFCSKAKIKDSRDNYSEEWYRARLVWSLVNSGAYNKEYICVELSQPKGNTKTPLRADIVVFKTKNWLNVYEKARQSKDFRELNKKMLVVFEAKKRERDNVLSVIENQLHSMMEKNTSKDRIFGIYFDNKEEIIILKKLGNSDLRRFYEDKELREEGLHDINVQNRDQLINLPSQRDFIENNESISNLEKLKFDSLDVIDESTFTETMNILKRENDRIRPKSPVRSLIVEFLTLKVFDEKRSKKDKSNLQFYILPSEKRSDGLAEKTFKERIDKLYQDARKKYKNVLSKALFSYTNDFKSSDSNDEKFLIAVIETFQQRAILKAKNESFNQIIFNNFGEDKQKVDKGQFFTPIPVVQNIIKLLNPIKGEDLCDPCCGIADFPAIGFRHSFEDKVDEFPDAINFYGFDLEDSNLKLAELNLVLNGDGDATLKQMDSLSQKLLENGEVMKNGYFTIKNFNPETWENLNDNNKEIKKYKIIATNPPFGKGRDLKINNETRKFMELYETWKIKTNLKPNGELPKSMDMGVLFLENSYKLLEDGGRMGIILSNSIASIKEWENIRKWLIDRMRIVALFDLPSNTFGETGVATTIIIAYKPKLDEKSKMLSRNYEVFIKEIKNIGYEVSRSKIKSIQFVPNFIIDEKTFEKTSCRNEDFTEMRKDFKEFLKRQEEEIKEVFHLNKFG
ncbi:SAM-dependent DNA methyltransferase [Candidatus Pacearchaeota archaeon]|nr:SAM-dependent DNA methyltransferase [Candidatus Pacearchaeota archaeon]